MPDSIFIIVTVLTIGALLWFYEAKTRHLEERLHLQEQSILDLLRINDRPFDTQPVSSCDRTLPGKQRNLRAVPDSTHEKQDLPFNVEEIERWN